MSLNEYEANLDKFYKLKNQYYEKINREKQRLIANKELSKKEKRIKFNAAILTCINCKQRGGTIFDIKNGNYRAVCGNTDKPCSLNINFQRQRRDLVDEKLIKYIKLLASLKEQIIRIKIEYLMGIISEEDSIVQFTTIKKELSDNYEIYKELLDIYHKVVSNLDNQDEIKEKNLERQQLIAQIRQRVEKYNFNGNLSEISEIVEIYLGDLDKVINSLRTLHYKMMYIIHQEEDKTNRLIKTEYSHRDLEIAQ